MTPLEGIVRIAPIDIAHKNFNRKVMGLDPDEVAAFLRDIADQMEELVRERNALKESIRQKEIQLMEYKERDETLKATLSTATKMCEQIRHDSEREAQLIINDASQKAELVMREGRDQLKRMYQEIADVKKLRMQFEVNLRALCQSHMQMIESSHLVMPDPQINLAHAATVTSAVQASNAAVSQAIQQSQAAAAPAPTNTTPPAGATTGATAGPPKTMARFRNPLANS